MLPRSYWQWVQWLERIYICMTTSIEGKLFAVWLMICSVLYTYALYIHNGFKSHSCCTWCLGIELRVFLFRTQPAEGIALHPEQRGYTDEISWKDAFTQCQPSNEEIWREDFLISQSIFKSVRDSGLTPSVSPSNLGKTSNSHIPDHTAAPQGLPSTWLCLVSKCLIHQWYASKFLL